MGAPIVNAKGRSAEFYAETYKTVGLDDKQAILAACRAASAFGKGGVVKLSSRTWEVGTGLKLAGYSCTLEGTGASFTEQYTGGVGFNTTTGAGTVLKASTQAGPVLSLDGWLPPANFRGRLNFGGFTLVGNGTADATLANSGIKSGTGSGTTNAIGNLHFHDIVISGTGGPCLDMDSVYLCDFSRITLTDPVGVVTNNVPWALLKNSAGCNFYSLGFQSMRGGQVSAGLGGGVGPIGALVITADDLYRSGGTKFWGTWMQNLHLPVNGTFIDSDGDAMEFRGTYFVDQGPDVVGVQTGMSWARLRGVGNIWDGYVPDGGPTSQFEVGIRVYGDRNRIVGPTGYGHYSVELMSGASNNYVSLEGSHGLPQVSTMRVLDNSGNATNIVHDGVYGQGTMPGWKYKSTGTGLAIDADTFALRTPAAAAKFSFSTGAAAGVVLPDHGALPAAAVGLRGKVALVHGEAGVADRLVVCRKNAADGYEWADLP